MSSLRARLIFSHLLPVLLIIPVVILLFVYLLETQVFLSSSTREITTQAVLLSDIASDYTEIWVRQDRAQAFVDRISSSLTADVLLTNQSGELLVSSSPAYRDEIGKQLFTPNLEQFFTGGKHAQVSYNQDDTITDVTVPVITPAGRLAGFVRLVNPLAGIFQRSNQLRQIAGWLLAGGLLLGGLLGWLLANDLQKPLQRATRAVNDFSTGRQLSPLPEQGPDEIRLLLRSFNSLAERMQTLEESRKRLLANLVHELGRPIGALQSGVQAMIGGADEDPALRQELLHGMDDELHRMRNLVEDLASLHEQVLGSLELNPSPVAVSDWLARVSAPWREAAQEKGLAWEARVDPDLPTVSMDPDRMAQAVGNLLSNAVRYTPQGGKVELAATLSSPEVLNISVRDSGPGIGSGEADQIFVPFYRGKAARRFSDGMGLGLTIAQDLVTGHGGKLVVDSVPGKGSTFTIQLPIRPTAAP